MSYIDRFESILHMMKFASYAGEYFYAKETARTLLSKLSPQDLTPEELKLAEELCREADCKLGKERS